MKKLLVALGILCANFATAIPLKDITFSGYRVLYQGVMMDKERSPVTYIITASPPMAIMVPTNGTALIARLSQGKLSNCEIATAADEESFRTSALQMSGVVGELEMVASVKAGKGHAISEDARQYLEAVRNYIHFINESIGKPLLTCA